MWMNENTFLLLNNEEWTAMKKCIDTSIWVDYARYCDKFNSGSKWWWIYFKTPISGTKLFSWGMIIQHQLSK